MRVEALKTLDLDPHAQMLGKLHAILQDNKIETVNLVTRKDSDAESFYMKHGYAQAQRVGMYIRHLRD